MKKLKIVMVDDHNAVRSAIAAYLSKEPDIEVVGQASDTKKIMEIIGMHQPDILLMDAHMPGHNVLKMARKVRHHHPNMHILVLSAYDQYQYVVSLLDAGASGYVLKSDSLEMLVRAIHAVARGEKWLSPHIVELLVSSVKNKGHSRLSRLTKRETEVLQLVASGCNNGEIAETLVITKQTVKNHVRNILHKLGVETRVEAILFAVNHGFMSQGGPDIVREEMEP